MAEDLKAKPEIKHWADQIAEEVMQRVDKDPMLQKVVKKNGYIVYDEKTPSGVIHIGSGRGWVIHDAIAKAMRDAGLKAKFILSSDDIDPYDKPNKELPKEFDKYLGMPFRNIPSPVSGYKSFADYYFMQCVEKFGEFGIDAEIESTGERYENGSFNPAIKTILDNHHKVKAVFERIYSQPYDKLPFNVICEKCGKIATTRAIEWDSKKEILHYRCEENFVKWAKGCNHEGWIRPYDGNGKFPWKVEWAAKWPTVGVVCEYGGKDHFTKGGSRDVAIAISDEVLDYPPPYPSTRKSIGKGYEFFNVGGKKMSTSKGVGFGFAEITKSLQPKLLRYLLIKSRINAVIDFDPYRPNDIILLYDRYDKAERIYFGLDKGDEHDEVNQKRIYELSHVGKIPDRCPIQIPLSFAAMALQIGLDEEGALDVFKKTGHIPKNVSGIDLHAITERLHDAKNWLDRFAPEESKFTVQEKVNAKVGEKERKALHKAAELLKKKKLTDKELHNEFYNICKELELEPKDFFKAAYLVLLNRERGPQLASFVLTLGEKAVRLFEMA